MSKNLPPQGVIFWPVGTGDSTTIVVRENQTVVQVDLHDNSEADREKYTSIVDELVELLPKRNGRPYLSTFILTHPDRDHIKGFQRLLDEVEIDEIWHTPRIFREYEKDAELCEDAKAFRKECDRRRKVTIENYGEVEAGDRVRIIGHDVLYEEDRYKNFPRRWRGYPGTSVTELDSEDVSEHFEAFIHAPFKDDCGGNRNESSLVLHITLLSESEKPLKLLLFGDVSYPRLKRIVEKTVDKKNEKYLEWHNLLATHHCSKYAMYQRVDGVDILQKDPEILKEFEKYKLEDAYVIASADLTFTDDNGSNPPHKKARKRYEEIVDSGHFLCTHEHGDEDSPERIEFVLDNDGVHYSSPESNESGDKKKAPDLASATVRQRATPATSVGFGESRKKT